MTTIANAQDVTEACLIKSRLEAEGIDAFIPDENTAQIQLRTVRFSTKKRR